MRDVISSLKINARETRLTSEINPSLGVEMMFVYERTALEKSKVPNPFCSVDFFLA